MSGEKLWEQNNSNLKYYLAFAFFCFIILNWRMSSTWPNFPGLLNAKILVLRSSTYGNNGLGIISEKIYHMSFNSSRTWKDLLSSRIIHLISLTNLEKINLGPRIRLIKRDHFSYVSFVLPAKVICCQHPLSPCSFLFLCIYQASTLPCNNLHPLSIELCHWSPFKFIPSESFLLARYPIGVSRSCVIVGKTLNSSASLCF